MMLDYLYPVIVYYGDEPDDYEKTEHQGMISPIQLKKEPYEVNVNANGFSFHVIFGHHQNGWFLCIPNWSYGCELSHPSDLFWNLESMTRIDSRLDYEDLVAVAHAIKMLSSYID